MSDDHDVWPECSMCHVPYIHRLALSFTKGRRWVWEPDCLHGRRGSPQPQPMLMTVDGPYEAP